MTLIEKYKPTSSHKATCIAQLSTDGIRDQCCVSANFFLWFGKQSVLSIFAKQKYVNYNPPSINANLKSN
jgi:hypothetical protein